MSFNNYFMVNLSDIWWDEGAHQKYGGPINNRSIDYYTHIHATTSPVLVEWQPTDHGHNYKLRNGRHRVMAAMRNGQTCILARFWDSEKDGVAQEPDLKPVTS